MLATGLVRAASIAGALCAFLPSFNVTAAAAAAAQGVAAGSSSARVEQEADGVVVRLAEGELRLQVLSDAVVRVAFVKDGAKAEEFFGRASIDVVAHAGMTSGWKVVEGSGAVALTTAKLRVTVDRKSGAVSFADASGRAIAAEAAAGRGMEAAEVQGDQTFHVQQRWRAQAGESLYGLGQMQLGITDIKGYDLDLWQHNTNIVVPFLVSSKGYGILWDNTSFTRFGDLRQFEAIPADVLYDADGRQGGLTVAPVDGAGAGAAPAKQTAEIGIDLRANRPAGGGRPAPLKRMRWDGSVLAPATGDYQFQAYSNGGIQFWFEGKLVMSHWRQNWNPTNDQVKVHMVAGRKYAVRLENDPEQQSTLVFQWKTPAASGDTSLWSEVGEGVDYTFVYGPGMDEVIAGYRFLTGRATMLPQWAFGLWQSRQRYETAEQSLDVVKEFRKREIPFDNIVQDWQYWRTDAWGSHEFDAKRFPGPDGWIQAIHDEHAHLMISVWGKFNPNTDNAKEMDAKGFLYQPNLTEHMKDWINQPYTFYDAFNPEARKLFWAQLDKGLFSKHVDAWWMDATEPDVTPSPPSLQGQQTHMNPTYLGTGSRMLNGYALMNSEGVYTGEREAAPNQRVFILTRSGFAGQQSYSAVPWSGDITSTWTAMYKQIAAGLGASISGMPYWTMDTGGYTLQRKFSQEPMKAEDEAEWRELNARWFEYSTFTPLLRVHGELRDREMWTLGDAGLIPRSAAYDAELKFDRLRYALFPYIYSLAGWTTQKNYTMMRPMVMDFAQDRTARELSDEYMFGPALLVAPVTEYQARTRSVYLPAGVGWFDYWTGNAAAAGADKANAAFDEIPVFVRAGSIVPYAPAMQYVGEKASDPTTLWVYAGANGSFDLYEDQGTTFDYEKGAFAEIPMRWDESAGVLTLGKRVGRFDGMLQRRTFKVVLVSREHPVGYAADPPAAKTVQYAGDPVRVKMR
jgi:alpha-D-xyloside xylohydrolase